MTKQTKQREKKETMFVLAESYTAYADWFNQFCPIPEYIDRVEFLSSIDKIRGFSRKTTRVYLLGNYWKNKNVSTVGVKRLGYKIQGKLSNFIRVNGEFVNINNLTI